MTSDIIGALMVIENNNSPIVVSDTIQCTDIKKSNIHGHGLFAKHDIRTGTILCTLDGQHVSWKDFKQYNIPCCEWNALDGDVLLIRSIRTKYGYINHSRDPNCMVSRYPMRVTTLKHIQSGEELTLDYRREPLPLEYIETANYL